MRASPLDDRTVLVLGATGFLGRWVARACRASGAKVVLHGRERGRLADDLRELSVLEHDLAPRGSGRELLRRVPADCVLNLAGYGVAKDERDEELMERLNHELVEELLEGLGARAAPCVRLVQVGSALEAGPAPASLEESAECRPDTPYGRSKLAATTLVEHARKDGLAALSLRPFTVFGAGERPGRLLPSLLAASLDEARATVPLSEGSQRRDWVYVEDVARAVVELAMLDPTDLLAGTAPFDAPTINVATGALTSVREFVLSFAGEFALNVERLAFGTLPGLPEEMHHPHVPVERLRKALGWTPSSYPADGLKRLHERMLDGIT